MSFKSVSIAEPRNDATNDMHMTMPAPGNPGVPKPKKLPKQKTSKQKLEQAWPRHACINIKLPTTCLLSTCLGGDYIQCGGVLNWGTQLWMIFKGKNPTKMDDLGMPPILYQVTSPLAGKQCCQPALDGVHWVVHQVKRCWTRCCDPWHFHMKWSEDCSWNTELVS